MLYIFVHLLIALHFINNNIVLNKLYRSLLIDLYKFVNNKSVYLFIMLFYNKIYTLGQARLRRPRGG